MVLEILDWVGVGGCLCCWSGGAVEGCSCFGSVMFTYICVSDLLCY